MKHSIVMKKTKRYSSSNSNNKNKGNNICNPFMVLVILIGFVSVLSLVVVISSHNNGNVNGDVNSNVNNPTITNTKTTPITITSTNTNSISNPITITSTNTNSNTNAKISTKEFKTLDGTIIPMKYLMPSDKNKLLPFQKKNGSFDMHFIHIPKCGGTSMTSILRKVACAMDPIRNVDCCTNPGFCDWHAFRRCQSIRGCINHIPQRPWIFKPPPSITIMREPTSRLVSAYFYRGHSPNNDFFQVRPYFKDVRDGKLPKVEFPEYIEMPEYQNIQTRMLGGDSFPYRNITITKQLFEAAVEALEEIFFIGIQEAYEISVKVLLREMNMSHIDIPIEKERDMNTKTLIEQKNKIKKDDKLMARVRAINAEDIALYQIGVQKFCITTKQYPDLLSQLKQQTSICDQYL